MNDALRGLEQLVGEWDVTLTHAWFLDSLDTEIQGTATVEWYADAFLLMRGGFRASPFVDGRQQANQDPVKLRALVRGHGLQRGFLGSREPGPQPI